MTAGVAATLLTALPVASAQAATPKVMIMSGAFSGYALCASPTDDWVWLKKVDAANPDAFCLWKVIGASSQFTLYNPAKDEVMAYTGGNEGVVVMEDSGTSRLGANGELWSWGGQEGWGASALQSFWDSGQNVDAKDGFNNPRTDPVHTRGWRHGSQRELTWNAVVPG
ncbi:hypothetical protein OHV05_36045 (plasmid) [Kitasatospora sp. NBC_00070]|uniref:hypothetical protein n=1 Tax=Kitasatospora sp. NBC_00070 TaxID=2975962 RepID=UPI002F914D7F